MRLRGIGKKIVLECTYQERHFPKSIGARWDARLKAWSFSPSIICYRKIIDAAKSQNRDLKVDQKLKDYFDKKEVDLNSFKMSNEFKTKPRKYQIKATEFILKNPCCFLLLGVGTGKSKITIDAITILHANDKVNKVLVVSPASIMWNFANEISVHSHLDSTIIYGRMDKRKKLLTDSSTIFDIINYEVLDKLEKEIIKKKYDAIIFDEIHYCKNKNSKRSKQAYKICRNIPIKIGLTGTLIGNGYEDAFMPFKIIEESIFGPHFTRFKERYFITGGFNNYEVIGYNYEDEIKKLIASISIRFDIRDVIKDLPEEQEIVKYVHLSDKSMRVYKELKTHMMIEHDRGDIVASNVLERMIRLSQICSGFLVDKENSIIEDIGNEKLEVLKNILEGTTEKTAIFCKFTKSIDNVAELCEKMGISYYVYDGRTKDKNLYLKYENDDTRVWIAQLQKTEGYSIKTAQYCIFYEMTYSRKDHTQAKGRILRGPANHDRIFYIYLIAKGTIDEAVKTTLIKKDFKSHEALELVRGV